MLKMFLLLNAWSNYRLRLTSQPEPSPPGSVFAELSGTPPSSTWNIGPAMQHCHSNRSLSYTAVLIGPHGSPVAPSADSLCPFCLGKETCLSLWSEFAHPVCSSCTKTTGVGLHNVLCKDIQLLQNIPELSTLPFKWDKMSHLKTRSRFKNETMWKSDI